MQEFFLKLLLSLKLKDLNISSSTGISIQGPARKKCRDVEHYKCTSENS